jgi:hypothetical protein
LTLLGTMGGAVLIDFAGGDSIGPACTAPIAGVTTGRAIRRPMESRTMGTCAPIAGLRWSIDLLAAKVFASTTDAGAASAKLGATAMPASTAIK